MKSIQKLAYRWYSGFALLIFGDTTSYFTYVTLILCEIHVLCLYVDVSISKALIFMAIFHILNVIFGSVFKGKSTTMLDEIICCVAIIGMFTLLTVLSIMYAPKLSTLFTVSTLLYTLISNGIRKLNLKLLDDEDSVFGYYLIAILDKLLRVIFPFALFVFLTAMWRFPIWFDISLAILFFIFMPYIALLENLTCGDDLFELPFQLHYDNDNDDIDDE